VREASTVSNSELFITLFTSIQAISIKLPRIFNNKLKFPPLWVFLSSPYFTHDASCIMLNIDWTSLDSINELKAF